ncbi:MAG: gamma-glutamylcyclotransferase family protein [Syntrophorhabdales bacterium]|jgi:cation transport regulator ChaC
MLYKNGAGQHITLFILLMTLYFAYGSNMDLPQMGDRCPDAVTAGTAELPFHRFIINTRGVATAVPDPASTVQGLLWNISEIDERALDYYEGVTQGIYRKAFVEVNLPDGTTTRALTYLATDTHPGPARAGYAEKILSAAEGCGLPKTYIDQLKRWLADTDSSSGMRRSYRST